MHNIQLRLALPDGLETRKDFHQDQWYFPIIDVMAALVGGGHPRKYWNDLRKKLITECYFEVYEKIRQFKMLASAGKPGLTCCTISASKKKGGTE